MVSSSQWGEQGKKKDTRRHEAWVKSAEKGGPAGGYRPGLAGGPEATRKAMVEREICFSHRDEAEVDVARCRRADALIVHGVKGCA